jgi:hypothetical protein
MFSSFQQWLWEVKSLTIHKYNTLTPQDYCVMLVLCCAVGLTLLRSRNR